MAVVGTRRNGDALCVLIGDIWVVGFELLPCLIGSEAPMRVKYWNKEN